MAQSWTAYTSSSENASVVQADVVDRSLQPVAGTAETFVFAAASARMGFNAIENGSLEIRLQSPAGDPETSFGALFDVADAINRLQAEANTVVTVTIDDGQNPPATFAGDGFSIEARGDSTATWRSHSGVRLPDWMTTLNGTIDSTAPSYVHSATSLLGQDIGDNPEITFVVTPHVAQVVAVDVTSVQDPAMLDELKVQTGLARQALDEITGDDLAATAPLLARVTNGGAGVEVVELDRLLAQDGSYSLPTGVTASLSGAFSADNATSLSLSVITGAFGDVKMSWDGNSVTPTFVEVAQQSGWANDDAKRLEVAERKPRLELAPGAIVVLTATSRS